MHSNLCWLSALEVKIATGHTNDKPLLDCSETAVAADELG